MAQPERRAFAGKRRAPANKRHAVALRVALVVVGVAIAVGIVCVARVLGSKRNAETEGQAGMTGQAADSEGRDGAISNRAQGQDTGQAQGPSKVQDIADDSSAEEADLEQPRSTSELARMFQQGEVGSIRLVGDSITAGFGTTGYVDANLTGTGEVIYDDGMGTVYRETPDSALCWANEFRRYASDHGTWSFVNAGINGAFMRQLAGNPDAWLADGADVVFVALGTNDAGYYGPEEYRASAEAGLLAAAQKSKLLVVLSPVSDLRPASQLVEPAAELGDVLRQICDAQDYLFVDMRDAVPPEGFNNDGLHPTSEGSLAMWSHIQAALGL